MKIIVSLSKQELLLRKNALMGASKPPIPHVAAKLLGISVEEYHRLSDVFVAKTFRKC